MPARAAIVALSRSGFTPLLSFLRRVKGWFTVVMGALAAHTKRSGRDVSETATLIIWSQLAYWGG
jgi:hypothetical protein